MSDPTAPGESLDHTTALRLLREGTLSVEGRLVDASNATLLAEVTLDGTSRHCVYKPVAGERPLWDFPDGTLAGREVAAYHVSEATGWSLVPPTVYRDGPFGPGMCQLWVEADPAVDVVALLRGDDPQLRRMAVFDAVINNADRKGSHVLPVPGGHLYAIDHGVCFAAEDKLRTLLWQWRGEPLTDEARTVLGALRMQVAAGSVRGELDHLLATNEVEAMLDRIDVLLALGAHPYPSGDWPALPWPPF